MSVQADIKARNDEIAKARQEGTASLSELADKYGISRERVRQIAADHGVSNREAAIAFFKKQREIAYEKAESCSQVILMRWIGGENLEDIARSLHLSETSTQEVIDENVTDKMAAMRSDNLVARRFPSVTSGPAINVRPRDDRFWTEERTFNALCSLAWQSGGKLPTSNKYQEIAPNRSDLPSFKTIRNRLGRYSSVRAQVHEYIQSRIQR